LVSAFGNEEFFIQPRILFARYEENAMRTSTY
jgi:hypothetical protein